MRHLLLLLLLFLLVACAPKAPVPPMLPADAALKERLLEELAQVSRAFRSAKGLARVKVRLRERDVSARQVLFVEKPDRLRAETLSPFGQPMLVSATDGDTLSVYLPGDGVYYHGAATLDNFQRFVPIPLQIADLVHILLYQVPVIAHNEVGIESTKEGYRLILLGDQELRQILLFDREQRLQGADYLLEDVLQLQIRYTHFRQGVHPFPLAVDLQMPAAQASASLEFSDVQTNTAIPRERFDLEPPAGVEIRSLP